MLVNKFYKKGFHQYKFDDLEEAIQMADHLHKKRLSVSVIQSQSFYYVESPASLFLRSWERRFYLNGRRYQ